jgi:hypothetical protein
LSLCWLSYFQFLKSPILKHYLKNSYCPAHLNNCPPFCHLINSNTIFKNQFTCHFLQDASSYHPRLFEMLHCKCPSNNSYQSCDYLLEEHNWQKEKGTKTSGVLKYSLHWSVLWLPVCKYIWKNSSSSKWKNYTPYCLYLFHNKNLNTNDEKNLWVFTHSFTTYLPHLQFLTV